MRFKINATQPEPARRTSGNSNRKMLYAIIGIAAVAIILVALMVPGGLINNPSPNPTSTPTANPTPAPTIPPGDAIPLSLNYTVGEKMYYTTINNVTNQDSITPASPGIEPTTIIVYSSVEVLGFDGEKYTLNQTSASATAPNTIILPLVNASKTSYYNNFIAPGAPQFFANAASNPVLTEFITKTQAAVRDTWVLPVSTGNESYGLTGSLTFKFESVEIITVPAGSFSVFKISISSDNLVMHANLENDPANLNAQNNTKLSISGQTYLEYGTCRVIKAELHQVTTSPTNPQRTSIIDTEKILAEIIRP